MERYKNADKEERKDLFPGENYLTFYSRLRTASLDLELYDPILNTDWHNPKLDTLARNVRRNYEDKHGGQVVFCDRVFSGDGTFNIHEKIKQYLCDAGFKPDEIVMVNGFTKSGGVKSDNLIEKEVSQAVAAFNRGRFKVIIGSTACIGEGLNLQENSSALHHFDIPFRPSDFIQRNGRIDRQGNKQQSVELHTYLAAGTIDNYSVSLVQRKANWIDQLLKTKSHVFTNPNDENYIDADELLLALTEEWGDKDKADERKREMEQIKAVKMLEAQHEQRRNSLAALSLMRNTLLSYSGDKGNSAYQNRIHKAHILEKQLKDNPTFTNNEILGKDIPFLYNKTLDRIIRKNDMLIMNGRHYEIAALNPKRQECRLQPFVETNNEYETTIGIRAFHENTNSFMHIQQPVKEERQLIRALHTAAFYRHPDTELKARYYPYHIQCANSAKTFDPVVFKDNGEGSLLINQPGNSYLYGIDSCLNPYTSDGAAQILKLADKGLEFTFICERAAHAARIQQTLPELYALLKPYFTADAPLGDE